MIKFLNSKKMYYLIIIDLLFFPYFKYFVMPIFLPIVVLDSFVYVYKNRDNLNRKKTIFYFILFLLILSSVFVSLVNVYSVVNDINVKFENIKRMLLLILSFSYYLYFSKNKIPNQIVLRNILIIFCVFYIVLGAISLVNVGFYFKYLDTLGVYNPFVNPWYLVQQDYLFRYSYIYSDPNNSAYLFQIITFFIITNFENKNLQKIFLLFLIILSLFIGMSTGSMLSFLVTISVYVAVLTFFKTKNEFNIWKIFTNIVIFFLVIIMLIIAFRYSIGLFEHQLQYSLERMTSNSDGGRLNKYMQMFSTSLPSIIGEGYILIRDGQIFRPHSDHLRMMYSYGIISYLFILYKFFSDFFRNPYIYIYIVPAFFCFSFNSLLDEPKIIMTFLMILGMSKRLIKEKNNE